MNVRGLAIALALLVPAAGSASAQVTVLDQAQDQSGASAALPCGAQPLSIARMGWPSATLLAEIHALILTDAYDCEVSLIPGDLAASASSMGSTGQPAMAPEMWVNRVADVWNAAIDAQMVRSAAPSYQEDTFEGWYMPSYLASSFAEAPTASELTEALPALEAEEAIRFISCPPDWGCAVINRNLVAAHGIGELVEIVEPANRFEMDQLIAEAVNRKEPFLFYYWQPNAILAQLDFVALDMGIYDEEAAQCLADRVCTAPAPSAFPPDLVVNALAEEIFVETPAIAGYFQRASLPLAEMDALLAQLNAPEATPEAVAKRFVAERREIWESWVNRATP